MRYFVKRRISNSLLAIVIAVLLLVILQVYGTPLYRHQIWSGWLLFTLVNFLIIYNWKKKLPNLPLGSNALWLQFHSYVGIIAMVIFLQHINLRIPTGKMEGLLASLFVLTALSGVAGIFISRVVPKYLTRRGEEVFFERIPLFIAELRRQAETIVLDCAKATGSTAMNDYYQHHLVDYFTEPKHIVEHLLGLTTPLYVLKKKHQTFCRYLNQKEQPYADQLLALIVKKNELDLHYALQGLMKTWGFVHVPLSYSLILVALVHVTLVYAFIGGV